MLCPCFVQGFVKILDRLSGGETLVEKSFVGNALGLEQHMAINVHIYH